MDNESTDYRGLVRLIRVARALEGGGFYNAAKLLWAAAFSQEIRASRQAQATHGADDLDGEMAEAIHALSTSGARPELIEALSRGRQGAKENRTIPLADTPAVHVCRVCGEIMLHEPPRRCPSCSADALTFREFLPTYYLEPLDPHRALETLSASLDEVSQLIGGLSEAQVSRPQAPGEWSLRDALDHLRVAEGLLAGRIEKMLAEDDPSLSAAAALAMVSDEPRSAAEVFAQYRALRMATLARLRAMSLQSWWRTGRHEEFGRVTILQQASYFAKHERSHLPQMEAIRRIAEREWTGQVLGRES